MRLKKFLGCIFTLISLSLIVWAGVIIWQEQNPSLPITHQPSPPLWQSEPIVPTVLPTTLAHESQKLGSAAPLTPTTPSFESRFASFSIPQRADLYTSLPPANALKRFGVGVPFPPLQTETAKALGLGWYLAWRILETPNGSGELDFWQMIRVSEQDFKPEKAIIHKVAQANPGATWLIGNEPDVIWQDNITPARYAERYHELYHFLKAVDPTCQVAIGGVTQPTPLRLQYLERVMSAYQLRYGELMPVEV